MSKNEMKDAVCFSALKWLDRLRRVLKNETKMLET